jgi:uncharacterized membrane protein YgaE (UPF0421/DUF939 family)
MRQHFQPFHWRHAALCVPAIPLLLALGIAEGDSVQAAVAAGAAFSVGFGATRDLGGQRWGAMLAATLGMSLAAFVGSIAGQEPVALMILAAFAAATCAALALFDEDMWWVVLQIVIALLVAGYYPNSAEAAVERAVFVLTGGTVQIVAVVVLARLFPWASERLPPGPAKEPPPRILLISHALRAALCVAVTAAAADYLELANGYWAPMTALLILKPGLHDTHSRGIARLTGTLIGCGAATLFAAAVHSSAPLLILAVGVTAGTAFGLQKAQYTTLTCAITGTVVLFLSLGQGSVIANAEHRIYATLLGGAIALAVSRIAPHRPLQTRPDEDRVGAT